MRLESTPTRWPALGLGPSLALAAFLGGVAWAQSAGPFDLCPLHRLTGLSCPTCGSTRLVLALAQGDVPGAAALNPLVFAAFAALAAALALRVVARRRCVLLTTPRRARLAPWLLIGLLLVNWVYVAWTLREPAVPGPVSRVAPSEIVGLPSG